MALVRLKRNWFGPNGIRYRKRDGLVQIPDGEVALLPRDAEVVDAPGKALPSKAVQPEEAEKVSEERENSDEAAEKKQAEADDPVEAASKTGPVQKPTTSQPAKK